MNLFCLCWNCNYHVQENSLGLCFSCNKELLSRKKKMIDRKIKELKNLLKDAEAMIIMDREPTVNGLIDLQDQLKQNVMIEINDLNDSANEKQWNKLINLKLKAESLSKNCTEQIELLLAV